VLGVGTRNVKPDLARERTRAAVRLALARDPRLFQIKYCSTFDSTPEGNIGPSIDAAMEELGVAFTVAFPALPVNGRTTYQGYHFVNGRLLSDSPMRHHPLTPMTNPDLVSHLSAQTARRVGLAPYTDVDACVERLRERFNSLRDEGVSVAVVDCLNDHHVETICRASVDLRLVTGGSAFGMKLPTIFRERGWVSEREARGVEVRRDEAERARVERADGGRGRLVVAGSCSEATRAQNSWLASRGVPLVRVEPEELLTRADSLARVVAEARAQLAAGRDCLITTTGAPEEVRRVQKRAAERGQSVPELGGRLAYALADLVAEVLEGGSARGLVVAGGETSGAICRRLELGALRVGRNIEPGVPVCLSLGRTKLPVVLKSGNFGGEDFYAKALQAIERAGDYLV
jgi:uncharacterized protein YgbK (DUF1537 family)